MTETKGTSPAYQKVNALASALCKSDKGKSEASIGDMREILCDLSDMAAKDPKLLQSLVQLGQERAEKAFRAKHVKKP